MACCPVPDYTNNSLLSEGDPPLAFRAEVSPARLLGLISETDKTTHPSLSLGSLRKPVGIVIMLPDTARPTGQRQQSCPESDLARVRENQRRSRARRKGYLQELESKLRKCEALGVQASVDIQLAARVVSEENARLRGENGKLREENERLRQVLDKGGEGVLGMADKRISHGSRRADQKHAIYEPGDAGLEEGKASHAPAPSGNGMNHYHGAATSSGSLPYTSTKYHNDSMSSGVLSSEVQRSMNSQVTTLNTDPSFTHMNPTQSKTSSQCYEVSSEDLPFGDDTSSCEYAAHIITSMRADVSSEDVRADLGCGSDVKEWRKCTVGNSKLFTAVDRYTG